MAGPRKKKKDKKQKQKDTDRNEFCEKLLVS
jgi:hypothetical protein